VQDMYGGDSSVNMFHAIMVNVYRPELDPISDSSGSLLWERPSIVLEADQMGDGRANETNETN